MGKKTGQNETDKAYCKKMGHYFNKLEALLITMFRVLEGFYCTSTGLSSFKIAYRESASIHFFSTNKSHREQILSLKLDLSTENFYKKRFGFPLEKKRENKISKTF